MSSWEGSACYPRSTFYPLSDGPSMRNRRITMLQFPACAACRPPSQAPLCHCTLRTVTNRPEGTFRSLRYAFGGDHPSQTARQTRSAHRALGTKQRKGRISTAAPRILAYPLLSLRPILHIRRITMPQFPACSACLPPSQAPLCHCTLPPVTNRREGTFRSLRYSFGGDHPSQTARQAVSPKLAG